MPEVRRPRTRGPRAHRPRRPRAQPARRRRDRSRSGCSSRSPASPAPASRRWSTTSSTPRWPSRSTTPAPCPGRHTQDHRARARRQGDPRRPVADRAHPAVQPRDVHRRLRPRPQAVRPDPRGEDARLPAGPVLLQRQGRPLRGVPGDGTIKIEMNFLPDVYVPCEVCHGARYNRETLEVHYKGKTIAEVLDMPIEEAAEFFAAVPAIARHMKTLVEVGLGYVRLGPAGDHALRWRGAAGEALLGAAEALDRPHRLRPRRADHRTALRGHPQAAAGAGPPGRPGQHGAGDRAQPRRHQDRRLAGRHGPRGRLARRHGDRRGHPRAGRRRTRTATPGSFLAPLLTHGRSTKGQARRPRRAAARG